MTRDKLLAEIEQCDADRLKAKARGAALMKTLAAMDADEQAAIHGLTAAEYAREKAKGFPSLKGKRVQVARAKP